MKAYIKISLNISFKLSLTIVQIYKIEYIFNLYLFHIYIRYLNIEYKFNKTFEHKIIYNKYVYTLMA